MSAVKSGRSKVEERTASLNWNAVCDSLRAEGNAVISSLLTADECSAISNLYNSDNLFRKRIVMKQHGYGSGEYKYFAYPLPEQVAALRSTVYPHLVDLANQWNQEMKIAVQYPETHAEFIERCHQAGQVRPTPLILQYEKDDFNCLHQDLYGEHVFPLQLAILLSEPGKDFTGGEFIMTEQRPRMQTKPIVVPLRQGDGVIFAVHNRPVKGTRGSYRVNMRHGVSKLLSGHRKTMGIIFHDAK